MQQGGHNDLRTRCSMFSELTDLRQRVPPLVVLHSQSKSPLLHRRRSGSRAVGNSGYLAASHARRSLPVRQPVPSRRGLRSGLLGKEVKDGSGSAPTEQTTRRRPQSASLKGWAAFASSPTSSPTRSPPARSSSGRPPSSRNSSKTPSTPAPPTSASKSKPAAARLIRIADNGRGMLRDDALLAFERHATSKLRDVRRPARHRHPRLPRRSAALHRLRLAPRSRDPLGRRNHRHPRRDRRRQASCACDEIAASPPAPPSPSAISSSTCPRARNSCAPNRPSSPTSPRSSPTTASPTPTRPSNSHNDAQVLLDVTPVADAARARLPGLRRHRRSTTSSTSTPSSASCPIASEARRALLARLPPPRLRLRPAGAEAQSQLDLPLRQRPPDSRQARCCTRSRPRITT